MHIDVQKNDMGSSDVSCEVDGIATESDGLHISLIHSLYLICVNAISFNQNIVDLYLCTVCQRYKCCCRFIAFGIF